MRKILSLILSLVMLISMCSCKRSITAKVVVISSGYGIAGQSFAGRKEYDLKNIKEGDIIIEYFGEISNEIRSEYAKDSWVMKIDRISDDGVEVTTRERSFTMSYGIEHHISSLWYGNDMPEYNYFISFA